MSGAERLNGLREANKNRGGEQTTETNFRAHRNKSGKQAIFPNLNPMENAKLKMRTCRIAVVIAMLALDSSAHAPAGSNAQADNFWLVFLETGNGTPQDKALVAGTQQGHFKKFERLVWRTETCGSRPGAGPASVKRGFLSQRTLYLMNCWLRLFDSLRAYFHAWLGQLLH